MELILRFSLILFSMTGYLLFFHQKYQIRIEFAPALFCAWTSNLLFLAGLLNVLPHMVWLLWAGGVFLLIWSWKEKYRLNRRSLLFYGIFLCVIVFFFCILQGAHITKYDNFSHWATVVKDMLRENRMPNFEDAVIRFQSYPLGSSLFIYGICLVTGSADGCMLWAQLLMQISFLSCLAVFIQKKNWNIAFVFVFYSIWALSVNNSIYELRVDTLLPLAGVASFAMIYEEKHNSQKALYHASGIWILLINIKNSGIFFYAVCLFFYAVYYNKELKRRKLCFLCTGLFAPLFTMFLWKRHVAFAFSDGMSSKHSMNLAHFEEMAAKKTADDVIGIGVQILKRFLNPDNLEVKMMLILTVFLLMMATLLRGQKMMKTIVVLLASSWGCLAVYTISLFAMYVFSMPMGESARLASYDRYVLSVLIFIFGIAVVVITDVARVLAQIQANQMHHSSGMYQVRMLVMAAALFSAVLVWQVRKRLPLLYQAPDFDGTKRSLLQELIQRDGLEEGDSCFIYCNGSDDDARYFFYLTRYELWSNDILVVTAEEFQEKQDQIEAYDYLVIWETDEQIKRYLNQKGMSKYAGKEKTGIPIAETKRSPDISLG